MAPVIRHGRHARNVGTLPSLPSRAPARCPRLWEAGRDSHKPRESGASSLSHSTRSSRDGTASRPACRIRSRLALGNLSSLRATVVETSNPAFGLRKIKVRFHQPTTNSTDGAPKENDKPRTTRQEQYVPIDWLILPQKGEPLPDNFMYRSPFPTVHIIVNSGLAKLSMRDVSKVKRLNSKRVAEFGWEGLRAHG